MHNRKIFDLLSKNLPHLVLKGDAKSVTTVCER